MVESEAKELSEEIMLGAVTFGQRVSSRSSRRSSNWPRPAPRSRGPWPSRPPTRRRSRQRLRDAVGPQIEAAYRERGKQERSDRLDAAKAQRGGAVRRRSRAGPGAQAVQGHREGDRARRDPARRRADRRARHQDGAADRLPGRHVAARPRLGAVHPRRNPGARRRDARHRPGRADHRRARRRVSRKLHAALQFPALFDRRGRAHGFARTPRDRSRQARLARGAAAVAAEGELPLHDPRRLGDHRSRTARRRWLRYAAPRWR